MTTIPKKTYARKKQRKKSKKSSIKNVQEEKLYNNAALNLQTSCNISNSQQFSLDSDYWKDSFDKLLGERSILRKNNIIKKVVNASYNRNSFYQNTSRENSRLVPFNINTLLTNTTVNKNLVYPTSHSDINNTRTTISTPIFKNKSNEELIFPISPIHNQENLEKYHNRKFFSLKNMYDTKGNLKNLLELSDNVSSITIKLCESNSLSQTNNKNNSTSMEIQNKLSTQKNNEHRKTTRKRKNNLDKNVKENETEDKSVIINNNKNKKKFNLRKHKKNNHIVKSKKLVECNEIIPPIPSICITNEQNENVMEESNRENNVNEKATLLNGDEQSLLMNKSIIENQNQKIKTKAVVKLKKIINNNKNMKNHLNYFNGVKNRKTMKIFEKISSDILNKSIKINTPKISTTKIENKTKKFKRNEEMQNNHVKKRLFVSENENYFKNKSSDSENTSIVEKNKSLSISLNNNIQNSRILIKKLPPDVLQKSLIRLNSFNRRESNISNIKKSEEIITSTKTKTTTEKSLRIILSKSDNLLTLFNSHTLSLSSSFLSPSPFSLETANHLNSLASMKSCCVKLKKIDSLLMKRSVSLPSLSSNNYNKKILPFIKLKRLQNVELFQRKDKKPQSQKNDTSIQKIPRRSERLNLLYSKMNSLNSSSSSSFDMVSSVVSLNISKNKSLTEKEQQLTTTHQTMRIRQRRTKSIEIIDVQKKKTVETETIQISDNHNDNKILTTEEHNFSLSNSQVSINLRTNKNESYTVSSSKKSLTVERKYNLRKRDSLKIRHTEGSIITRKSKSIDNTSRKTKSLKNNISNNLIQNETSTKINRRRRKRKDTNSLSVINSINKDIPNKNTTSTADSTDCCIRCNKCVHNLLNSIEQHSKNKEVNNTEENNAICGELLQSEFRKHTKTPRKSKNYSRSSYIENQNNTGHHEKSLKLNTPTPDIPDTDISSKGDVINNRTIDKSKLSENVTKTNEDHATDKTQKNERSSRKLKSIENQSITTNDKIINIQNSNINPEKENISPTVITLRRSSRISSKSKNINKKDNEARNATKTNKNSNKEAFKQTVSLDTSSCLSPIQISEIPTNKKRDSKSNKSQIHRLEKHVIIMQSPNNTTTEYNNEISSQNELPSSIIELSSRHSKGIRKISSVQESNSKSTQSYAGISSSKTLNSSSSLVLDTSIDKADFVNTINKNAAKYQKSLILNNVTLRKASSNSQSLTFMNNSNAVANVSRDRRNKKSSVQQQSQNSLLPSIRDEDAIEQDDLELSKQNQKFSSEIILPPGKWRKSLLLWKRNHSVTSNGKTLSSLSPNRNTLSISSVNNSLMKLNNLNYSNNINQSQCNRSNNSLNNENSNRRKITLNGSKTIQNIPEEDQVEELTESRRNSKVLLETTDDEAPTLSENLLFENPILKRNLHISSISSKLSTTKINEDSSKIIENSNEPSLSANERRRTYQQQFSIPSSFYYHQQQQQPQQYNNQQTSLSSLLLSRRRRTSILEGALSEEGIAEVFQQKQKDSIINYQLNKKSLLYQRNLSTKDIVLRRCEQSEPIDFSIEYSENILHQCRKIGEGVYGEVFMNKKKILNNCNDIIINDGDNNDQYEVNVLKIIPIEGNVEVNGEPQKKFDEILSEIVIATELSRLRNDKEHMTSGFVEVKKVRCVQGSYPEHLIDLWELYRDNYGTENDHPEIFPEDQLYIVLELANGGQDLEAFTFENALQSYSAFLQTALTLAIAESKFKFEHRDLHWGNILLQQTKDKEIKYRLNGKEFIIPTYGVKATIIDYTLSRMIFDGCCFYNDLSNDDELFSASGDYQFDIYRTMKKTLDNDWERFEPYTNILWLHYVIDKMISGVRYRYSKTKKHRAAVQTMMQLRDELLDYKSASDYVVECFN